MISGSVTWATAGMPVFLKSSGAKVDGPEVLAAYLSWAGDHGIPDGIESGLNRLLEAMVAFAKVNAPWTDRTGEARRTLGGEVVIDGKHYVCVFGHGVDYGIWLEVSNNGQYGIVLRTQEVFSSKAAGIVAGEIDLELAGKGSKFRSSATGRFV